MNPTDYLRGVYNITPTPFHPDGSLDTDGLVTLTNFTIDQGVDGMTILGVMGETSKVTDEERDQIIAGVLEAADGRIPICVGATHTGTLGCVAYSKRAQELGARAVMVAPPKLGRSNDEALRRHYLTVAEAIDIPIVVQDHPPSSNITMSVDFIARIAEEAPQCRYLKQEDDPTPPKISRVLAANPDIQVFGGLGGMMFLEELKRGAIGCMTGFGFPRILVEIFQKFSDGDIDGATDTFYRYCPLIRFEAQNGINLAIRKQIYHMQGAMASAQARAPFAPLDEGTQADLADLLTRLGLQ
jgi:4-hydroxy-tetrahydrodipicolinate synthase